MQEGVATAILPLRSYAQFRDRSTRFEVILFAILIAILFLALGFAEPLIGAEALLWAQRGLLLALACPILALIVRRLHDGGRTGWWALLGLPLLGFELWEAYLHHADPLAPSPIDSLPLGARLALAMTGVVLAVLLLWDDEAADNEYGANPRYGPHEVAA